MRNFYIKTAFAAAALFVGSSAIERSAQAGFGPSEMMMYGGASRNANQDGSRN